VVKDTERDELVDVIRRVMAGERVVSIDGGGSSGAALSRKLRDHGLTRREYDILRRVAMGETNPEIASALGLTRNTVKTYLQRTLEKLGRATALKPCPARASWASSRLAGVPGYGPLAAIAHRGRGRSMRVIDRCPSRVRPTTAITYP